MGVALMATVLGLTIVVCGGPQTPRIVPPGALTLAPCKVKTVAGVSAAAYGPWIVPEHRAKAHARVIALISNRSAKFKCTLFGLTVSKM